MPTPDSFENHQKGLQSPLTEFALISASNGDPLPFVPRAILLTANGNFTVAGKDSVPFTFTSGWLALGVWHPMRMESIADNDQDMIIAR